jgi:hypothetical protein
MRAVLRGTIIGALLLSGAACKVDKLVDPPPTSALRISPARVEQAAAVGSTAPRTARADLTSARASAILWSVRRSGSGAWMTLERSAGTTPDSLTVTMAPDGLAPGLHQDTLIFTPDDEDLAVVRVPVLFSIEGCAPIPITLDAEVADSLRTTDCGSSQRPGAFARRYRFSGEAGDSITVTLSSSTLSGFVAVDTAEDASAHPFATSGTCTGTPFDACLRYLRLPHSGTYTLEVTTVGDGPTTGAFTLRASRPRAPTGADSLGQFRADSATTIAVGGTSPEPGFVVRGVPVDPDPLDSLTLEVEVQTVGTTFTGEPTTTTSLVASGRRGVARVTGLVDATSYHWRARAVDQTGRATAWRSFGGNPESAADLRVTIAATRLAFRGQPSTTAAGAAITPAVEVIAVDGEGHLIPSFRGAVTVRLLANPAGGTLSGDRSATPVDGVASFPGLNIDRAGIDYTLQASATGLDDAVSDAFTILPGPATQLSFTQQPTTASVGRPISPAVRVTARDAHGNVATAFTGDVTMAIDHDGSVLKNATLGGDRTVAAAAGVATFPDLSIDQVGSGYTLAATASGTSGATSSAFNILPIGGSPTSQRFNTQPTSTTAGQAVAPPVEVTILDALGARVPTFDGPVALTLATNPGGSALSGTLTRNAVSGIARFDDLRLDRVGTGYQLRATTAGLSDVTSDRFDVTPTAPTTGVVRVTTATSGTSPDPDGYTATLGSSAQGVASNGTVLFTGVPPGSTTVTLSGIASNCTVTDGTSRSVTVVAGDTVSAPFTITCAAIGPTTGSLRVTTATAGTDLDPNGYIVTVGGGSRPIGVSGNELFADLAPGGYTVTLGGVAGNCTVGGANPRQITVTAGNEATTAFTVTCSAVGPTTGSLRVTTATTGTDLDPNGYTVTVGGGSRPIGVNGNELFADLAPGSHTVTLTGLATNCLVVGTNSRQVTVAAGSEASTAFSVACVGVTPPTASALRFSSQPPSVMVVAGTFGAAVQAVDQSGALAAGYTGPVTMSLEGGILGTTLTGTRVVNATGGVIPFSDLRVTGPCLGCRLRATASGLTSAVSDPFTVVVP